MAVRPFYVNGEWRTGEGTFEVHSPYDDSVVAEIGVPTDADVEESIATAAETFRESRFLSVAARSTNPATLSRWLLDTSGPISTDSSMIGPTLIDSTVGTSAESRSS